MSVGKIAVRYARALFEAAKDENKLAKTRDDLKLFLSLDEELSEFRDLIMNPVLSANQKKEVFANLFKGKVEELSMRFIVLLTENKREAYLPSVCRVFMELYREMEGVKSALVSTASEIEEETVNSIGKSLEEYYKCKIELKTSIKPELIGGFILRVEDQQIDTSVAAQLRKVKKGLNQSVIS